MHSLKPAIFWISVTCLTNACGMSTFSSGRNPSNSQGVETSDMSNAEAGSVEKETADNVEELTNAEAALDAEGRTDDITAEIPAVLSGAYLTCVAELASEASSGTLSCLLPTPELKDSVAEHRAWIAASEGATIALPTRALLSSDDHQYKVVFTLARASMKTLFKAILEDKKHLKITPADTTKTQEDTSASQPIVSLTDAPVNLIQNGSFEQNKILDNDGFWQKYSNPLEVPFWSLSKGDSIELQANLEGWHAADGQIWVELDSTLGSMIEQIIPTRIGGSYELSFAMAARPDTDAIDNVMLVHIGGLTKSFAKSGLNLSQPNWEQISIPFTASATSTSLRFEDGGSPNSKGTFLDKISVWEVAKE